jgi:hypothetical protein
MRFKPSHLATSTVGRDRTYALSSRKDKYSGLFWSNRGVISKRSWIASVAKLSRLDRRFTPRREGNQWCIQLCPAFELKRARESADLSSEGGIYRYRRGGTDEIVYIGRGPIKARLKCPERGEWNFDIVEYSVVPNPDEQVKWEDYWIERFKAEHDGKRPLNNRISGFGKHRKGPDIFG